MSSEKLLARAAAARRRASAAGDAAHRTMDMIPYGQPVMGSTDRNRRDRAWANIGKAGRESDLAATLEASARRVARLEQRTDEAQVIGEKLEGLKVGDTVIACFTNCNRLHRFTGVIVKRTINDWKVKTTADAPYGEAPGRIFTIPAAGTRKHSANNRIYKLELVAHNA